MAGTSKHFIFTDTKGRVHIDHKIIPALTDRVVSMEARRRPLSFAQTLEFRRELDSFLASQGLTWRKKILVLWERLKSFSSSPGLLTEVKVRPNASRRTCTFRDVARNHRKNPAIAPKIRPVNPKPPIADFDPSDLPPNVIRMRVPAGFTRGLAESVDAYLRNLDMLRRRENQE